MKYLALLLFVAASYAIAQTVILEDGTRIELKPGESLYISDKPVYTHQQLEPVTSVEPEMGTPEWCAWYEANNPNGIVPDFSEEYREWANNCS